MSATTKAINASSSVARFHVRQPLPNILEQALQLPGALFQFFELCRGALQAFASLMVGRNRLLRELAICLFARNRHARPPGSQHLPNGDADNYRDHRYAG